MASATCDTPHVSEMQCGCRSGWRARACHRGQAAAGSAAAGCLATAPAAPGRALGLESISSSSLAGRCCRYPPPPRSAAAARRRVRTDATPSCSSRRTGSRRCRPTRSRHAERLRLHAAAPWRLRSAPECCDGGSAGPGGVAPRLRRRADHLPHRTPPANSGSASGNGSVWPLPELSARAPPVQRPKQALTQLLYGRRQAEKHCAPLRRSVHCSAAIACRCQRTSRKFLEQ